MTGSSLLINSFFCSYKLECEARKFTMDYGDELIAVARKQREMEDKVLDENGNLLNKKDMKVNYIIDQLVNHEVC